MKDRKVSRNQGCTLVELLIVAVVLAVLSGLALVAIGRGYGDIVNVKLRDDVESLNEAVQVYLASGGSMEGVGTVRAALVKLKTKADEDSAAGLVGLCGTMLDPRIDAELMTAAESASSAPRA